MTRREEILSAIREHLLELVENHYNIKWVQAYPTHEEEKSYLQFYNTQDDAQLGRIEINALVDGEEAGDMVREVKYPLLDPATLEKHLQGMRKWDTKYKKYHTHYEQTILDNINLESYEMDTEDMSDWDKCFNIERIFHAEYVHPNNRHQDQATLFAEWLTGLPSVLTVPFYNYDIIANAEKAGFEFKNEAEECTYLSEYWGKLADAFFTLRNNL